MYITEHRSIAVEVPPLFLSPGGWMYIIEHRSIAVEVPPLFLCFSQQVDGCI